MVLLILERHVPSRYVLDWGKNGYKTNMPDWSDFRMLKDIQTPPENDGDIYDKKFGHVSFSKGYWWHFEDGDDDITVHCSTFSGQEWVYINDELVSENLGLTFNSRHEFIYEGANYILELKLLRWYAGQMRGSIYKNTQLIGEQAISFFDGTLKSILKRVWPIFIAGFIAGAGGVAYGKSLATGETFKMEAGTAGIAIIAVTLGMFAFSVFMRKKL